MRVTHNEAARTVAFKCPGCGWTHVLNIDPARGRPCWGFNGDVDRPTITPSINAWGQQLESGQVDKRCHSFVTDGRIQCLSDCTHDLVGQTVDLPEIEGAA